MQWFGQFYRAPVKHGFNVIIRDRIVSVSKRSYQNILLTISSAKIPFSLLLYKLTSQDKPPT